MAASSNQTEILGKLSKMSGLFDQAKQKSNPFAQSKLTPDLYIFHLTKAGITLSGAAGKEKVPTVTFRLVCLGAIGPNSLKDGKADLTYRGEQYNHRRAMEPMGEGTLEDAIERLIFDFQDIGFITKNMILTGTPKEITEPDGTVTMQFTMIQALQMISDPNQVIYMRGAITETESKKTKGQFFKNLNFRGSVSNEEMEMYFGSGNFIPIPTGEEQQNQQSGVDESEVLGGEEELPPDDGTAGGEYVGGEGTGNEYQEYVPEAAPEVQQQQQAPQNRAVNPNPAKPVQTGTQQQRAPQQTSNGPRQVGPGQPRPANSGMRPAGR